MNRDYIYLNRFIWDEKKSQINKKKHKISFELAARIFNDPGLYVSYDTKHSDEEDRELYIGSCGGTYLVLTVSA